MLSDSNRNEDEGTYTECAGRKLTRQELYFERKAAGLCTRCGEPADLEAGSQLCTAHRAEARSLRSESAARVREARRAKGLCAFCPRKSSTYRCAACAIKFNRIPTVGVDTSVDNRSGPEWRAGTTASDAMTLRYRGRAARGAPPASVLDAQDTKQILVEIERGIRALEYTHSAAVQALPASERKAARKAALQRFALAGRFIEDLLERYGYED